MLGRSTAAPARCDAEAQQRHAGDSLRQRLMLPVRLSLLVEIIAFSLSSRMNSSLFIRKYLCLSPLLPFLRNARYLAIPGLF